MLTCYRCARVAVTYVPGSYTAAIVSSCHLRVALVEETLLNQDRASPATDAARDLD
jgi:hypothetical protein